MLCKPFKCLANQLSPASVVPLPRFTLMLRWHHRLGNTNDVTNVWSPYTITPIHWHNSAWHRPPRIRGICYICVPHAITSDLNSSRKRIICCTKNRAVYSSHWTRWAIRSASSRVTGSSQRETHMKGARFAWAVVMPKHHLAAYLIVCTVIACG